MSSSNCSENRHSASLRKRGSSATTSMVASPTHQSAEIALPKATPPAEPGKPGAETLWKRQPKGCGSDQLTWWGVG